MTEIDSFVLNRIFVSLRIDIIYSEIDYANFKSAL